KALQRATVVLDRHAGDLADQPVRDPGRNLARYQPVLALVSPADDDVIAVVQLGEKLADVRGIVLQVAVHRHDVFPSGEIDARGHRRRLPEVATELDDPEPRVLSRELL